MTETSQSSSKNAATLLEEVRELMALKGENIFKVRAFEKAAVAVADVPDLLERAKAGTLTQIEGVGKSIADVLTEFLLTGQSKTRDELKASIPEGLFELTRVPGLGPKKAIQLIEELEIRSLRELEYACRENRLLKLKGFGDKIQHKILEGIRFLGEGAGQARLCDVEATVEACLGVLLDAADGHQVVETGALRRRMETLSELAFLIELPESGESQARTRVDRALAEFRSKQSGLLPIELHFSRSVRWGYEWARTTASPAHWQALGAPTAFDALDEAEFYAKLELPVIPAEARETGEEVRLAREGRLGDLLGYASVQGVFHNHTTRSDGTASLEQMVVAAKNLGYRYIGISDHSQTAFYAQGLKVPDLLDQEREIRKVQDKHPEIRVFWGIESDILADGSLDYEPAVLKKFDFVIASIHSRFKADREAMTDRILSAIRNPCTRFLGHATGRLLLGRPGYDLDMDRVIAEAARCDVAIEINANPARLDIDWRWGPKLRECGTRVSVNPDAHEVEGLKDTRYGIAVARKALLPVSQVVNARSVAEVEKWLRRA